MYEIKAVIFDWGGVLIDDPMPFMMKFCASELNLSEKKLIQVYQEYANDFQTNRISEESLWKEISARLGIHQISIDLLWMNAFKLAYKPKKEMFTLLSLLKSNEYKTGLLSNTEKKVMDYFYTLDYHFIDIAVFSCGEKIMKPDLKIYKIILRRMNVMPEETIFIDDKIDNIKGAKISGMKPILFENPLQVRQELIHLGVKL